MPTFAGQCVICNKDFVSLSGFRRVCGACAQAQSGEKPSVADEQHTSENNPDPSMEEGSELQEKDSE